MFLCSLCIVLFAPVISLQAMKVWQVVATTLVILVLWPLKSVLQQRVVNVLFFRRLTHAIDQCLEILRKAKIFHKSPKKTNLSLWTKCEMSYRWATTNQGPLLLTASPRPHWVCWEWGRGGDDEKPVHCPYDIFQLYFTYCFINTNKTSLVNVGRAHFLYF